MKITTLICSQLLSVASDIIDYPLFHSGTMFNVNGSIQHLGGCETNHSIVRVSMLESVHEQSWYLTQIFADSVERKD